MGLFGDKLRRERERKGITLDEISLATKINTRMLRALEEEQFELLPGGIFNKGFVRAYARQVGIDEDEAVSDYVDASGEGPAQKLKPVEQARLEESRAQIEHGATQSFAEKVASLNWGGFPWQKLAAVLGVVVLALVFWHYHTARRAQHNNDVASAALPTAPAVMPAATEEEQPIAMKSEPARKGSREKTPTPVRAASTPVFSAPPPGAFSVDIQAQDECWVEAVADGKKVLEEVLNPPALRSVAARREIIMKIGNAGALQLWFNGKKLPAPGGDDQVKTLAFNANGLEPVPSKLPDAFSPPAQPTPAEP